MGARVQEAAVTLTLLESRLVPSKTCSESRKSLAQLLKDAEGLVQLSNLQLRLALELRRKAERLAKAKKKPTQSSPKKSKQRRSP